MYLSTIMQAIRVRFLLLTPICIFLGTSISLYSGTTIDYRLLTLVFTCALLAHISVHLLNEYSDYKSGLDLKTKKTPFSGGSGALPQTPEALNAVFVVGLTCLITAIAIGLFLVSKVGLELLPIGLIGILVIITYTDWLNKNPLLCLIAPGLGFGILMVLGTHFTLEQHINPVVVPVALVPFFLYNNLLLLNQFPDIHPDQSVGRNHILIAYGLRAGYTAYGLQLLAIALLVITPVISGLLPTLSLIALVPIPLGVFALQGAIQHGETLGSYPKYLASNVLMSLLTPVLLGVSLCLG